MFNFQMFIFSNFKIFNFKISAFLISTFQILKFQNLKFSILKRGRSSLLLRPQRRWKSLLEHASVPLRARNIVQRNCSKKLCSATLCSVPLNSASRFFVHGYARIHTKISIQCSPSRELVFNYRHPDPRRVWKGGPSCTR